MLSNILRVKLATIVLKAANGLYKNSDTSLKTILQICLNQLSITRWQRHLRYIMLLYKHTSAARTHTRTCSSPSSFVSIIIIIIIIIIIVVVVVVIVIF